MQGRLSLRERLLIVMGAALLPLMGVYVWGMVRSVQAATEGAREQLTLAASLAAEDENRAFDGAEQLLAAIAQIGDLHTGDHARCQAYFEGLRARYPIYTNIGLLAPDGRELCHALGARGYTSSPDRDYLRAALAQKRFVMGEAFIGRISQRLALPFAMPVIVDGEVVAVAFATLDVEKASQSLSRVPLPDGARLAVADRRGHLVMEFPQLRGEVLRETVHEDLLAAGRTMQPMTGETRDRRGELRLYAIQPTRLVGDQGFVVRVGISGDALHRENWERGREELLVALLVVLAALGTVWWIGGRMIVKPARQILGTVRRLEQGRFDARVPIALPSVRGEFARIGAAFNLMAESLQIRQADLEAELLRSRGAYAVLDLVLNSMRDALVAVSKEGRFLLHNEAAARLFDLGGAPVLPELWPQHFGFFQPDRVTPCRADELPLVRAVLGDSQGEALVFVRNARVPEGRMLRCTWRRLQGEAVRGALVMFTDVTELDDLQSEQAATIARLQEMQRKLIESQRIGRQGNWELDLRTGRLWWSDETFALFGIVPGEFAGDLQAFEERVHPEDRPLLKPARDQALRDGRVMNIEYRVVRPDGAIVWLNEIAEARRDATGEPVWFGGLVQDVTERKRHEEEIEASRWELEAYALMLQRAADAAQAITAQPTLEDTQREVVRQACRVLGAREALLRCEHGEVARNPGAQPGGDVLAAPFRDREGRRTGELVVWDKLEGVFTQREHWVGLELAQLASIAIENARLFEDVRGFNASLESRIAERTAELARQEQMYRALAEQAPEVVWHTDARGRAVFLNRAWYELVGGEPPQWLGDEWFSRVHPDDRDAVAGNWKRSRDLLLPYVGTRRVLARDGTYHTMSYKAAPLLDPDGQVRSWVGIDTDITGLKAIENALRSSNQELEAFSYSVSHDLRAPLGAISGFSRALEGKVRASGDERALHYLDRIQAGVLKMEELIEALLQLSRVVRTQLEWRLVDLSALARDTIEHLQVQEPARAVDVAIEDGLVAHGDPRLLRAAIENLVANAWKFTSKTERARIEVGRGDASVFFVRDNGVGFDMAYAEKLFNAFHRLHRDSEFPGTGIGLATVRRVIVRHQGRVWAESEPGRGTTFYFSLPLAAPPAWLRAGGAE